MAALPEFSPLPEFSHRVSLAEIGDASRAVAIAATLDQCAALARRFDIVAVDHLTAEAQLVKTAAGIEARGTLSARVTLSCVVTGQPVAQRIDEPFHILFTAPLAAPIANEVEIAADDCDQMDHDGLAIDLGEAAAQTLALALDPFPRADGAEDVLVKAGVVKEGEEAVGPFAALKALKAASV
jgi:uncharacterized metal-binding protein YceD (DUF177 family)